MRTRTRAAARRGLAVLMALLLALGGPLGSAATAQEAGAGGAYLSEVRVGVAGTAEEAARALEEDGWTVLKADGKPADLNQGANAALKKNRAVVLGYRTTGEAGRAITDLAAMNMSGGYSFADYAQLMDQQRDGQVRPFIERFMATVAEYRANAASESPGNRARADMARALLNRIVDDDTGGHLGDLLLEQTRAEMGDAYDRLPKEERDRHIDLETALMQGDSATVAQAERLLALAADSGESTWLERLSALGPDGLSAQLADVRPADAQAELDSRYQDLARRLAGGWEGMRAALLEHAPAAGAGAVAEPGGEDPTGQPVTELGDAAPASSASGLPEGAEVVEGDEEDLSALAAVEPPEAPEDLEEEEGDVSAEDVPRAIEDAGEAMGAMADSSAAVADARDTAIAAYLSAKPYGDGTLYDLFTRPLAELAGEGISALYPAASCLSAGQVAAMDFLTLTDLLQVGATTGDALAEVWTEGTGLAQTAEAAPEVSLYQGVDRDIFSDKVALTSEALRADALRTPEPGVVDFLSTYRRSALLWTGALVTGIVAGVSSYKEVRIAERLVKKAEDVPKQLENFISPTSTKLQNTIEYLKYFVEEELPKGNFYNGLDCFKVKRIEYSEYSISMWAKTTAAYNEQLELYQNRMENLQKQINSFDFINPTYEKLKKEFDALKDEERKFAASNVIFKEVNVDEKNLVLFDDYDKKYKSLDEYVNELFVKKAQKMEDELANANNRVVKQVDDIGGEFNNGWSRLSTVAGVAFFLLTLASIASTAYDVYSYYNVDYAPVPGYIVDVSDITSTAPDGTTTVVRNDRAYYRAATTDAERDGKDLVAMSDYADLNGGAGKEWLALYAASRPGQGPILADSLKVVVGTSSVPDGYSDGIHMFGSGSAANLTDARYCYNDDANGVYAYFKREAPAPAAASAIAGGNVALVGGLCLAAGAALGAGGMHLYHKRRSKKAAA